MIEVKNLTKRYGTVLAVDDLSFRVEPGVVTGFLGPNGSGKSTTMRMIMGLDAPTSGTATINGKSLREDPAPLRKMGALLDASNVQPGRTARAHLRVIAATHAIPAARVDEVLEMVGLSQVAKRRIKGFSLGMGQRLGIATALLGDPDILMFDEPVNGLDPEGIHWIRELMRHLASTGKTVFVSSHLMSEMSLTAEQLVVIGQGRLIAQTSLDELTSQAGGAYISVRSPQAEQLRSLLEGEGAIISNGQSDSLEVRNLEAARIGELASSGGFTLHELAPHKASLEATFMEMTKDAVQYQTPGGSQ